MKKCCFAGHRDAFGIEKDVYAVIKMLMEHGITEFYSGGMGNFDKLCEKAAKDLGGKVIYVPYNIDCLKMVNTARYDNVICPFGEKEYEKCDIPLRNNWLVDNTDMALCYVKRPGGAKATMDYAVKKKKYVLNMGVRTAPVN
ncbi:MAG: hypothetical protein J6C82_02390 [Clostridia bacterium]|nr:hypothetical protein [Clostridia bacterium]